MDVGSGGLPGIQEAVMHPEMLRMMIEDHSRTALAEAHRGRLVRALLKARRERRHAAPVADVVIPVIPDYVHEAFPASSRVS
jgi:hypothetical protein